MEGVMMKLSRSWAVTVRKSDGTLVSQQGTHVPWSDRSRLWKLPILRGIAVLFQMLGLGMRALFFSSDVMARDQAAAGTPPAGGKGAQALMLASHCVLMAVASGPDGSESEGPTRPAEAARAADVPAAGGMSTKEIVLAAGMALGMFLLLFKALPLGTAWLAAKVWPSLGTPLAESLISGAALITIFVGYLFAMSLLPDIRRVFQYHGAEHKVVHLFEAGVEPTVANAQRYSTLHPRCGTSFLFFMVLTSIVVWSLFPIDAGFLGKLGLRLLLFPLILGLSFELIRLTARHRTRWLFQALMAPGLWTQRITTKPPDDGMVAVSLHSLALCQPGTSGEGQAASH
jgi:uncharacterized protein YqhQ